MVVDWEVRLLLPVLLALEVDRHGRVWVDVGMVHGLGGRRVRLHGFPALAIVQLHPVVFTILNLARALQGLGEELAEVVVVGCVLEAQVTDVAEVLVELLCEQLVWKRLLELRGTYQGSHRTSP